MAVSLHIGRPVLVGSPEAPPVQSRDIMRYRFRNIWIAGSVCLAALAAPAAAQECQVFVAARGVAAYPCAPEPAAPAAAAEAAAGVPAPPPDYVIGPDDTLNVSFWRDQISADVVVRPDGRISLPLLNDVPAAGYTPEQLGRALEAAAAKYITEPNASVIVKEIRSRRVYVLGEVGAPGMVSLTGNMNVLQLISMVGGLLEHADRKNIVIIRTESGKETRLKFNYNDVVKGKNVAQNVLLRPGDTVIVR